MSSGAAHLRLAVLVAVAVLVALPSAAPAVAPGNDVYLQSLPVNVRGTPLTEEQVKDVADTREATVQGDLFAPPAAGGGAERTDCRATSFGATVWYDFHPHADGTVRVQAAGFDAAVGIYEFNPANSRIGARVDCANQVGPTEELFVKVKRGKSYTIQIGGSVGPTLAPATGALDFTFEYLSDRDGDGVLDALDKCPTQPGTASGCPQELRVLPTLRAIPTANGIEVRSLSVDAPRGARVQVRCGRGCAFSQARTAGTQPVRFAGLRNRRLPARARLEIFVTKSQSIGSYIRYSVTRGNFERTVRCLRPGSRIPRRSCK